MFISNTDCPSSVNDLMQKKFEIQIEIVICSNYPLLKLEDEVAK